VNDRERIRAFGRDLDDRCGRRVETPVGDGLFVDALPDVYFLNYLRGDRGTGSELAAEASGDGDVPPPQGVHLSRCRPRLGPKRAPRDGAQHQPDRRVETAHVSELPFEAIAPLRLDANTDPRLAERLHEGQRRIAEAIDTRWVAAFEGDRIASWCQVRSRGGVAQIEDVNTVPELRRRGHGRAVVQHALDEAHATHGSSTSRRSRRTGRASCTRSSASTRSIAVTTTWCGHPLTRLHIRTPRLELRLASDRRRAARALPRRRGRDPRPGGDAVRDPLDGRARRGRVPGLPRATTSRPGARTWHLNLVAFVDGRPVGTQA
jgi:predicted GNAT family acetyltransferase